MAVTIKHAKTDTIADWTQADLDAQIALGNFPPGTLLADIVLPSDWNDDHTFTGTLPVANGGTGQTTANAALNALLPSQSSQSGKVLSTDGTNTSWIAASGTGTVTSVTGTAPVSVATGTTTPVISMPAATSSVDGYLTSTDWNTFNNKGSGTVTSVSVASANGFAGTSSGGATPSLTLSTSVTGLLKGNGTAISAATSGTDYAPATSGTSILYGNGSGGFSNVTIGTNLTFTGGTLSATGGGGSGDVVGPASATDNAITRFDGTTGKLIQNSTVTLSDTGALSGVTSIVTPDYITYDTTATGVTVTPGLTTWNDGEGTLDLGLKGGNVTLNIGNQEYARVYNDQGSTITKGQVVYISGAQGNRIAVKLARANLEATSFGTLGIVAETITNGSEGWIIVSGALGKLNTTGLTAGSTVYLSPSTAGAITTTKPQAPDQLVVLGWVERVDNIVGSIYVKIDNGYELDELHDVQITSPTSGNMLIYDASTSPIGVWKNANLTAGTGISITNGAGSVTVTNSAPDQTVAITGAGGAVVTGTYPNFTITTPSGTVTSVTGTAPIASTGGATPAISISQATTSTDGYLSSTDWNTFNNKGSGTVTSVAALTLGTTGTDLSSSVANGTTTPVITLNVPTASSSNRGALSSADWSTFNGKQDALVSGTNIKTVNGTTLLGSGDLGTIGSGYGGTGFSTYATGDLIYASATNTLSKLAAGTDGYVLTLASGVPTWAAGGGGSMVYPSAGIAVSTGSAWGTSLTAPTGTIVGTTDTQTLTNKTLTDPLIIGTITEDVFTITDAAGFAIDPTNGSIQLITLGANRTPTQANWAAGEAITLMVNDGTAFTITWSTLGVVWVGGVAPTLATSGFTVIELWKVSTTIYGALVGSVA